MATATKERPILFSGPMVRAILEGRKTQTRRIVKPRPPADIDAQHGYAFQERAPYALEDYETGRPLRMGFMDEDSTIWRCPYGSAGERLWVRENGTINLDKSVFFYSDGSCAVNPAVSEADYTFRKPCPSIFMPRWASRITLTITGVRIEHLQDIRDADAAAEGFECRAGFRETWGQINGADSWSANPWVWVVSFVRVNRNE